MSTFCLKIGTTIYGNSFTVQYCCICIILLYLAEWISLIFLQVGVGDDNENGLLEDELNAAIATLESISSTLDADCVR